MEKKKESWLVITDNYSRSGSRLILLVVVVALVIVAAIET